MRSPEEGTAMRVELILHLETTDTGEIVWWADSPDVAGFSAAAPTLVALRERATAALRDLVSSEVKIVERLVGDEVVRSEDDARIVTSHPVLC
jgi:hypothetical protein